MDSFFTITLRQDAFHFGSIAQIKRKNVSVCEIKEMRSSEMTPTFSQCYDSISLDNVSFRRIYYEFPSLF